MILFGTALLCAYLLGSFPSARIAGILAGGIDIRRHGSGNAGATNTLRVLGRGWAAAVLCADLAKGALAVVIAGFLFPAAAAGTAAVVVDAAANPLRDPARVGAGLFVVIGHVLPIFSGFRGGKGVAPAAGMLTALFPPLAPVCAALFGIVLAAGKKASLASLVTAVLLPVVYAVLSLTIFHAFSWWILGLCSSIAVVVVCTHRANIRRLREGTEPDVGVP